MSVFRPLKRNSEPSEKRKSSKPSIFTSLPEELTEKPPQLPENPGLDYFLEDEDLQRQIERSTAQGLQGLIEGGASLPGNIANLLNKATGGHVNAIKGLSQILPTSEKIKEFGEKATLGYTKPQNRFEEAAKDFMGDVGASLPFGGATAGLLRGGKVLNTARLWQPIITPLLGQTVKQSAKSFGSKENSSDLWKIGSMILMDALLNRGAGSQNYINHLFQESERSIPAGATGSANTLRRSLIATQRELERGGTSPTTQRSLQAIDDSLQRIQGAPGNYSIEIAELPAFRRNLNAVRETLGGWRSELPQGVKRGAIRNLERVKTHLIDAGMDYGRANNPRFAEYWSAANEASNIASRSNIATRFLENVLSKKVFAKILGGGVGAHAVGTSIGSAASGQPVLGALGKTAIAGGVAAAVGTSLYETGKLAYRMARSPVLREYYSDLISAAVQQNTARVFKYSNKIEKELDKEDKKEKILIDSILKH